MKEDTVPKINSKNHVKRVLKTRHLSMIALGGSIGTGLFVASGLTISSAGPGGALVAYISVGIMVYFLMTSLGEMATYMPISGSFASYAGKFVDPALGFALGWNYWLNWVITLAVDITTVSIIIKFWLPNSPTWIFSLLALGVMFVINIISARSFAETEYWLSLIKILVILIFIFLGFLMIFGKLKQPFTGMQNFTYKKAPFLGLLPMLGAFSTAAFSFQGTELIGITAGESDNPEESIPKATKQIFWRILLFYILSIFVISCLIPYDNPFLLGSSTKDIAISPFTLVFKQSGLNSAASIMNFVILISVLSSANSGIYAATRMLYSLSYHEGALSIFIRTNKRGVPSLALFVTTFIGLLIFFMNFFEVRIYDFLVTASGLTGFIAWLGISISHLRFRMVLKKKNIPLNSLKYRAKFFPLGPILSTLICIMIILEKGVELTIDFNWYELLITYSCIPIFLILFLGYKLKHHTKLIPLNDVNIKK